MYEVALRKEFDGTHYLLGDGPEDENQPHSHHYRVEVILQGPNLDRSGYLVDIRGIEKAMDELIAQYSNKTLNNLPEFAGLNPSVEHLSRIICHALRSSTLEVNRVTSIRVRVWESDVAWASYTERL